MKPQITVETIIQAPIEKIWKCWNEPEHIKGWAFASDDWCAPRAENDLRVRGRFKTRMEAKDGSTGFDLEGAYTLVTLHERIEYSMDGEDSRKVQVAFTPEGDSYRVSETFEAEATNSLEMQRVGWQAILDNFKKHVIGE
jgi:uncharacterized protein YndB with AHSA1/START domain